MKPWHFLAAAAVAWVFRDKIKSALGPVLPLSGMGAFVPANQMVHPYAPNIQAGQVLDMAQPVDEAARLRAMSVMDSPAPANFDLAQRLMSQGATSGHSGSEAPDPWGLNPGGMP